MKTILALICLAVLAGCSSESKGLRNVKDKYPDSDVMKVPNTDCRFIVRKPDFSIWYSFSCGIGDNRETLDVELIRAPTTQPVADAELIRELNKENLK